MQLIEDGFNKILFAVQSVQHHLQKTTLNFDHISEVALISRLDADYVEYTVQAKRQIECLESDLKQSKKGVLSIVRDSNKTRHLKS